MRLLAKEKTTLRGRKKKLIRYMTLLIIGLYYSKCNSSPFSIIVPREDVEIIVTCDAGHIFSRVNGMQKRTTTRSTFVLLSA